MPEFWIDLIGMDDEYIIFGRGKDDVRIKHTTTGNETEAIEKLRARQQREMDDLLWGIVGGRP